MDGSDVLSFIRKSDYNSPKSVYDRLYRDFSKRNFESKFIQPSSSVYIKPASLIKSEVKIEDVLMQKQVASKSKLKALKAKYQAEEMKDVRKAPEINPVSKMIASQSSDRLHSIKSQYIASILETSRFSKMAREAHAKTTVRNVSIKLDVSRPESVQKTEQGFVPKPAPKKQENDLEVEKDLYLQQLRAALSTRSNVPEPEEPPSMLQMGVVERSRYWIHQKKQNIESIRREMIDKDLEGCTFVPELSKRSSGKNSFRDISRSKSVNMSYSELFAKKRNWNGVKLTKQIARHHTRSENRSQNERLISRYSPLSPASKQFGFKAGADIKKLINEAKPMVRYNSSTNIN